jgi:hypothetical protein
MGLKRSTETAQEATVNQVQFLMNRKTVEWWTAIKIEKEVKPGI